MGGTLEAVPYQVSDAKEDRQELGERSFMLPHGNYTGCCGCFLTV